MSHLQYMNQADFEATLLRHVGTPIKVEFGSVMIDDPEHKVTLAIGEMGTRESGGLWIMLYPDGTWSAEPIAP